MNKLLLSSMIILASSLTSKSQIMNNPNTNQALAPVQELTLTQEWDKVFPKSDKVDHHKVTFVNRYGITLAADLYIPKESEGQLPAIAVSGPFGAVKEQSSGLYAQQLAERGFLTLAFDPSFTGESGGMPRRVASPDINTEDFSAAVDYLSVHPLVDSNRIGILGVCGWGGIAIQAAINDPRIKATVASTMYDMTRVSANGYFDADNSSEKRNASRIALAKQRTDDYRKGEYSRAGGVVDPLPDDAPQFVKDYYDYYKTPRGFHPRSGNSTDGWNVSSVLPFVNFKFFEYAGELENAVLIVHGDKAHSYYFGKDTFAKLKGDNKQMLTVKGANHCDLYDRLDIIPMDEIAAFFMSHLK
ncbi:MAG: alpha/beta hydrolase [Bacteroides sp.]|nr:alpha/beta hydrolase [Bacteroides sp.]